MVIDPALASRFIDTYMHFLGTLVPEKAKLGKRPTEWLVVGRQLYQDDRTLLDTYRAEYPEADAEMLAAIAALKVERWVYLKDTTTYSVWLDERCERALGVLGLTQRLRDVAQGESGVVFHSGVMPLQGRWVSDGLVQGIVLLGSNLRRDFTAAYSEMRRSGRFSLGPD